MCRHFTECKILVIIFMPIAMLPTTIMPAFSHLQQTCESIRVDQDTGWNFWQNGMGFLMSFCLGQAMLLRQHLLQSDFAAVHLLAAIHWCE